MRPRDMFLFGVLVAIGYCVGDAISEETQVKERISDLAFKAREAGFRARQQLTKVMQKGEDLLAYEEQKRQRIVAHVT